MPKKIRARRQPTGLPSTHAEVFAKRVRQHEVFRLYETTGQTFAEIAAAVGVSARTAQEDYRKESQRALDRMADELRRWRAEHIVRVAQLARKAIGSFEDSKVAKVRKRIQRVVPGARKGAEPTVTEVQEMEEVNATGDPRFLAEAVKLNTLLAELLGMIGPAASREEDIKPREPQPGIISGPIIEVSAAALQVDPQVEAAIERARRREEEQLLRKGGTADEIQEPTEARSIL